MMWTVTVQELRERILNKKNVKTKMRSFLLHTIEIRQFAEFMVQSPVSNGSVHIMEGLLRQNVGLRTKAVIWCRKKRPNNDPKHGTGRMIECQKSPTSVGLTNRNLQNKNTKTTSRNLGLENWCLNRHGVATKRWRDH